MFDDEANDRDAWFRACDAWAGACRAWRDANHTDAHACAKMERARANWYTALYDWNMARKNKMRESE